MMGPLFGLLIRIKLVLDPPFPDEGLDRYDNRSLRRTATRRHLSARLQRPRQMPSEPAQEKRHAK